VEWHDCRWCPFIHRRRGAEICGDGAARTISVAGLFNHFNRRNHSAKPMKNIGSRKSSGGNLRAFTLVELLTVIAIIGILAGMLLPVLSRVKDAAKKTQAKTEMSSIVTAVQAYDQDYSRFPVSPATQNFANAGNNDMSLGGAFYNADGSYNTSIGFTNSEVIAILMDITDTSVTAVNANHQKNPKQVKYLSAKMSGDTSSPGVGTDLVYRDPWGNPYVITMDLNYDDQCSDIIYSQQAVSQSSGANGFNGLFNPTYPATPNNFLYHGKVMVWSAGPDRKVTNNVPANQGVNKDNVLSWQ
jgi:prepilin-type N-terminal cleavage/methylation domain-containing protein